jgi:ABC-type antimicrobial peptide transport system permease subunit
LHEPIKPLAIATLSKRQLTFNIALQPQNAAGPGLKTAIDKIEKAFKQLYPNDDFEYNFQDKTVEMYYKSETNMSRLLRWSTALTILISCLGLLGLVMFTINTRTKEIGIRKVLGASVANIVSVLSTEFMRLVLLGFLIAAPLAWWATYNWLQDFAYRTTMSWWVFILSAVVMLFVALVTLSLQTIKAATVNPIKSLRTE